MLQHSSHNFTHIETYDEIKVGKRIASGGDRVVYRYGDTEVIKVSSLSFLLGSKMRDKMLRDYETCKKYFGAYVVPTREVTAPDAKHPAYIEIQPFILGTPLRKVHAKNPLVHAQLREIADAMDRMKRDGFAPIDLLGHIGLFDGTLGNVFVDQEHTLHLIDTTLFELHSVGGIALLMIPLIPFVSYFQDYRMHRFLRRGTSK